MDYPNFQSPVIPGMPIEHHEHRRMVVVLLILIIVGIAGLVWWLNAGKKVETQPTTVNGISSTALTEMAKELKKSEVKITPQQKTEMAKELEKSVVQLTDKQKADMAAELMKSAIK